MTHLIHFLRQLELGDPCSLTLLALLLIFLGGKIVADKPHLYLWGLRLAVAGFVGFTAYQLLRYPFPQAEELLGFALRSLLAAGLVLGLAWILLPIISFFYQLVIGQPAARLQRWAALAQDQAAAWQDQQYAQEQRLQQQAEAQRAAVERDRQAEEQRRRDEQAKERQEEEKRQAEAALRANQQTVRQHLRDFYQAHSKWLAEVYPPAMLEAFIAAEMHDGLELIQLWAVCQKKIAELYQLVIQLRDQDRQREERQAARNIRLKKIEAEIAQCRQKIQRLEQLPGEELDRAAVEDEILGLEDRIRQLEEEKELLLTNNEEVNQ